MAEIAEIFSRGVKIEVGDLLPSSQYAERLKRVPPAWEKAFEVNAVRADSGVRASLRRVRAGRPVRHRPHLPPQEHGRIVYEIYRDATWIATNDDSHEAQPPRRHHPYVPEVRPEEHSPVPRSRRPTWSPGPWSTCSPTATCGN